MPNSPFNTVGRFKVGDWLFDPERNRLTRGQDHRLLEDRVARLLCYFVQHPNQVLEKETLLKAVWADRVVGDDSLSVAVSQLRKALDDSSRCPFYIKTRPGRGYQWVAPCRAAPEPLAPWHKRCLLWGVSLLLTTGVISGYWSMTQAPSSAKPMAHEQENHRADAKESQRREAIRRHRDILARDSGYAPAYLGIAEAKMQLLGEEILWSDHRTEIRALLERALDLDDTLADAHRGLANLHFWAYRDHGQAEQYFQRALKLAPEEPQLHLDYAQFLLAMGRFESSHAHIGQLRALDPLHYSAPTVIWIYQMQRRHDLALEEFQRVTRTEPENRYYHISAQRVLESLGDDNGAFEHSLWLMSDAGFTAEALAEATKKFQQGGPSRLNQWWLERGEPADLGQYRPPLSWARYAINAGDYELALDYLEQAVEQGQFPILWMAVDPKYEPIQHQPRFAALLRRLNLQLPDS